MDSNTAAAPISPPASDGSAGREEEDWTALTTGITVGSGGDGEGEESYSGEYSELVQAKARYLDNVIAKVTGSLATARKNVLPAEYYKIAAEMCSEERELLLAPIRPTRRSARVARASGEDPAPGGGDAGGAGQNPGGEDEPPEQPPAGGGAGGGGGGGGAGADGEKRGDQEDGPCTRPRCIATRTELASARAQLKDHVQRVAEQEQSLKAADTRYKAANTRAKNEKAKLEAELTAAKEAEAQGQEKTQKATQAEQAARTAAEKATAEATEAYNTARLWKERATAAEKKSTCKIPEHGDLEQRLRDNEQRASKLAQDLDTHKAELGQLQEEHKSCAPAGTWAELKEAVRRAKSAEELLSAEKQKGEERKKEDALVRAGLEGEVAGLRQQVADAQQEALSAQAQASRALAARAEQPDPQLQDDLRRLKAKMEEAQKLAESAKGEAQSLRAAKEKIAKELAECERQLTGAKEEIDLLSDICTGDCPADDVAIYPNAMEIQSIVDRLDDLQADLARRGGRPSGGERYRLKRRVEAVVTDIERETFAKAEQTGVPKYLRYLWEQAGDRWITLTDRMRDALDGRSGTAEVKREAEAPEGEKREPRRSSKPEERPRKKKVTFGWTGSQTDTQSEAEEDTSSDSTQPSPVKSPAKSARKQSGFPPPWDAPLTGEAQTFSQFTDAVTAEIVKPFSGQLEEYPRFRAHFISAFHSKRYAAVDKYHALMKYAGHTVSDLSNTLTPSAEAYVELVKRLEEEFGGQERQILHFSQQIRKCALVKSGAVKDMQKLVDAVQSYHAALPRGQEHEKFAYPHAAEVLGKLDSELKLAYRQHCSATAQKALSAPNIIKWLRSEQIAYLLQDRTGFTRPAPAGSRGAAAATKTRGAAFGAAGEPPAADKGKCPLCAEWHVLAECSTFLDKGPDARRNLALGYETCLRCLAKGHLANECDAQLCPQCGGNHHVLLCGGKRSGKKQGGKKQKREQSADRKKDGRADLASAAEKPATTARPGEDGLYASTTEAADPTVNTTRTNLVVEARAPAAAMHERAQSVFTGREASQASGTLPRSPAYVSLRYAVVRIKNPKTRKAALVNALIDGGASITTLAARAAQYIGLEGKTRELTITGYGGARTECTAVSCQALLESQNEQIEQEASITVVDDPVGELYATNWKLYKDLWEHLAAVPVSEPMGNGRVLMIVGADNLFFQRVLREQYGPGANDPVAQLTPLGWTISGLTRPLLSGETLVSLNAISFDAAAAFQPLEEDLLRQDEARGAPKATTPVSPPLELLDCGTLLNAGDREAINQIRSSRRKRADGKVEVKPLWKGGLRPGNNFQDAYKDWERVRRWLAREELTREYEEAFQTWIEKGFVRPCPPAHAEQGFFLKHFPVVRRENVTTKVRIVANGAAPYKGVSLNDCMKPGPKVINSLVQVLLRFRRGRVAVASDIAAMFLSVAMPEEDSFFHKFVFSMGDGAPAAYHSVGHVFGSSGSLTICVTVLKLAALELRHKWPDAAAAVLFSSMVDDVLANGRNCVEARDIAQGLGEIAAAAGLSMHKWASNEDRALPPSAEKRKLVEIRDKTEREGDGAHKSLGVLWDSRQDELTFDRRERLPAKLTKLSILKAYMGVFDPMGAILPFIMSARMMYSELWKDGLDWEEEVAPHREREWAAWFQELDSLPQVKLRRWLKPGPADKLVAFSDASSHAYGGVVYLVGPAGVRFVYARARINSNAARTIPVLELLGAELAVLCAREAARALEMKLEEVCFFTDSRNVLTWVRCPNRDASPHIARKVAQVREATDPANWHFVPTAENPADMVTRGARLGDLVGSDLWWEGPPFVARPASDWPAHGIPAEVHPDVPDEQIYERLIGIYKARGNSTQVRSESHVQGTSKWRVAVRALMRIWLWAERWLLAKRGQAGPTRELSSEDDWRALVAAEQSLTWPAEYRTLSAGKELPSKHPWGRYGVSLEQGVITVRGRTGEEARPLIGGATHLGTLLLRHVHRSSLSHCGGHKAVLAFARRTFWVLGGEAAARRAVRTCADCRRAEPKFKHPREAPLPPARTGSAEDQGPFTHQMVDFFGPLLTHHGRGKARSKRWVLVCTCMAVRAVALELVQDRTMQEVVAAVCRVAFKYGVPKYVLSDNAPEFVAAGAALAAGAAADCAGDLGSWTAVQWEHYPPYAPNFGGAVEAMVGLSKSYLKKLGANAVTTDLGLKHQLAHAEAILNLRPVGAISCDPRDPEPITAAHLLGAGKLRVRDITAETAPAVWREVVQHAEEAWEGLLLEALPKLFSIKRWRDTVYRCKVGDIVVVALQGDAALQKWPLGRVTEIKCGRDGVARRAKVLVGGKLVERAVAHLCPLF